jgi:hypothetical protein
VAEVRGHAMEASVLTVKMEPTKGGLEQRNNNNNNFLKVPVTAVYVQGSGRQSPQRLLH